MCGDPPTYRFSDGERGQLLAVGKQRQEDAIFYVEGLHPYLPGEVAQWNPLGNHLVGAVTELAVARWLKDAGVRHRQPPSVYVELTQRLPDITTEPHGVKIDVKGSVSDGRCRFPHSQLKNDADLVVVWCSVIRDDPDEDYNAVVPRGASIVGWSTMAEVAAAPQHDEKHRLVLADVRCFATLLEWVRKGARPA